MENKRSDIQILRALALMLVLFYHLDLPGFANGFLGVDLFFVISGFLIAKVYNRYNVLDFYKARLLRLLPAYIVTVTITTIVVIYITVPSDSVQRLYKIPYDAFFLSNFAFWAENSYFDYASFKPLLNLWSLGVEVQFYIIAPLLIYIVQRKKLNLLVFLGASLVSCFVVMMVSPKTSFFFLPTRLWEFLIGVFLFHHSIVIHKIKQRSALLAFCFLLLGVIIFLIPIKTDSTNYFYGHPSILTLLFVTLVGVIISVGFNESKFIKTFVGLVATKIGDMSYSIYLVHFPLIVLWNYEPFSGTKMGISFDWKIIFMLMLLFLLSYLLYVFVERQKNKRLLKNLSIISYVLLVGIVFYGQTISQWRYSEAEQKVFQATVDRDTYRCGKIFRIFNPGASICPIVENSGKNKTLLLGDSHADAIKQVFSEIMSDEKTQTYFGVYNNPLKIMSVDPNNFLNEIKDNNINRVVLHFSEHFFNDDNLKVLTFFIEMINSHNLETALILPVPSYKRSVPIELYTLLQDETHLLQQPNASFFDLSSERAKSLRRTLQTTNTKVYDPKAFLCRDNLCSVWDGHTPYYFDNSHLTISGARVLSPIFREISEPFVEWD